MEAYHGHFIGPNPLASVHELNNPRVHIGQGALEGVKEGEVLKFPGYRMPPRQVRATLEQ